MFPGPTHQMNASLNLVVTKILYFLFFCLMQALPCVTWILVAPARTPAAKFTHTKKEEEKLARSQQEQSTDGHMLYL